MMWVPDQEGQSPQPSVSATRHRHSAPDLAACGFSMKLFLALVACWLLALVCSDIPQPCTSPDLFEGYISEMHPNQLRPAYGMFSYDAIHQRFYTSMLVYKDNKPEHQVDLFLYNESVRYKFFLGNQTCMKFPLLTPFKPFGVPKDANFLTQIYVGSPSVPEALLLMNIWNVTQDRGNVKIGFSDYGCYPLYWHIEFTDSWTLKSFVNLTLGIQDPTVFNPPLECEKKL
ncbi:ependymin-like isoform X2 [Narcine bancroftii]|uniref:ependymin-like isoform X2 n=1 Tax=Narcine bancroftii TaxID=1343680 RepID=UPI0038320824